MNTAGCSEKKQYSTFTLAARAARGLHRRTSQRVQPYACQGCGFFHAGTVVGPGNLDGRLRRQALNRIREREAWA